ncbi:MAG: class I SAM-dependent methyltransferase [Spirochaetia bacterium]|jgi:ubiquinone/menaquinone biosynthesis C-methylase UbiE
MGIERQGARPTGLLGRLIGLLMNLSQTPVYVSYLNDKLPPNDSAILDIGCGGGRFLEFLSTKNSTYKLLGVDHSTEMIKLARKVNRISSSSEGKHVTIMHASVTAMPIESSSVDLATAFETVQFWPGIDESFSEVVRVLKSGGAFLIINRYPRQGSKWWKRAQIKSDREYAEKLRRTGFDRVETNLNYKRGWIIVTGMK